MISISLNKRSGSGANAIIAGFVSAGSDWSQTLTLFDDDGSQLTGVDSDTWQLQFRCDPTSTSADTTLSTTDGQLSITEGASETTLTISADQADISSLLGDYVADLVSKTSGGALTHRAHGIVTFTNDPIAF